MPVRKPKVSSKPARAISRTDTINRAFAAIGTVGPTMMPQARGAKEPVAYELFIAGHLRRLAEPRWTKALAAAVKADVIFNHTREPEAVGTNRVVYAGQIVEISVAVAAPIEGIDHAAFVVDLLKAGVKPALINRLTKKHLTETRPAHKFTSSLKTGK